MTSSKVGLIIDVSYLSYLESKKIIIIIFLSWLAGLAYYVRKEPLNLHLSHLLIELKQQSWI